MFFLNIGLQNYYTSFLKVMQNESYPQASIFTKSPNSTAGIDIKIYILYYNYVKMNFVI